jgi:hypothetical protein
MRIERNPLETIPKFQAVSGGRLLSTNLTGLILRWGKIGNYLILLGIHHILFFQSGWGLQLGLNLNPFC